MNNVVDGRLRFPNLSSGLVNRDLVLLGRLRVLGLIHSTMVSFAFTMSAMTTSIRDLAVTHHHLLDILLHQIQCPEIYFWCDHFERVVGVLLGGLARNLSGSLARLPAGLPVGS